LVVKLLRKQPLVSAAALLFLLGRGFVRFDSRGVSKWLGITRLLHGLKKRLPYAGLRLAAGLMRSTGRITNTAQGTVDSTQGGLRANFVTYDANSIPNLCA
jgi:hypothetical protein